MGFGIWAGGLGVEERDVSYHHKEELTIHQLCNGNLVQVPQKKPGGSSTKDSGWSMDLGPWLA